jgi:5-methylcytosine-specific restriction protein A
MDNATGRDFEAAIQARVDALWQADGGRDGSPDEVRSPTQRRLDALVELVLGNTATEGLRHVKHLVHIVVTTETGHAEFLDGTPVPTSYLMHLDPETTQIVGHVVDGNGRPLWLGRRRRLASVDQWLHLVVRDRGCTDCGAEPVNCEAHHVQEWGDQGTTDVDNLALKCHVDHTLAHHGQRRRHAA